MPAAAAALAASQTAAGWAQATRCLTCRWPASLAGAAAEVTHSQNLAEVIPAGCAAAHRRLLALLIRQSRRQLRCGGCRRLALSAQHRQRHQVVAWPRRLAARQKARHAHHRPAARAPAAAAAAPTAAQMAAAVPAWAGPAAAAPRPCRVPRRRCAPAAAAAAAAAPPPPPAPRTAPGRPPQDPPAAGPAPRCLQCIADVSTVCGTINNAGCLVLDAVILSGNACSFRTGSTHERSTGH